jgi:hypothetical protein
MTRFALVAVCLLLSIASLAGAQATQASEKPKLSGPYTHENLTLYLIHGPDAIKDDYLTLEEAMREKKVIVHETGNVNELAVENVSDRPVYIQSGEIVKGGKQDRTLANDLVLAPKSQKVPIAAFCVEHGRWKQRGGESTSLFSSSTEAVAGSKMKLAAQNVYKGGGGQQKVWDEAKENQAKLRERVSAEVAASASPSSFQLTLENKNVQAEIEKYVAKLKHLPEKEPDVIGYAVAINGKLACADSYGSSLLFRKMWPKLLKSAAVEAAAEFDPKAQLTEPTGEQIRDALAKAEDGKKSNTQLSERIHVTSFDASDTVLFETRDLKNSSAAVPDSYLHRNYLRKD